LVFQVPQLSTDERTLTNATNFSRETALDLGAYSIFPKVTGTSIGVGGEEWYKFELQRDGIASDLIRLKANRPLKIQLVDKDGVNVGLFVSADATADANLSLNGLSSGLYFLR